MSRSPGKIAELDVLGGLALVLAVVACFGFLGCAPKKVMCPAEAPVDFVEAMGFAQKAALAYEPDSVIQAQTVLRDAGASISGANVSTAGDSVFIFVGAKTGARGFVLRQDADSTQWLAFRGTQTLEDIRTDADYVQSRDTVLNLAFHRGFKNATDELMPLMLPHLNPAYRTFLTGHSLGGAMAAIAGLELQAKGFKAKAITFGQPKVTHKAGAKRAQLDLVRFIHGRDLVALVPPLDWAPGREKASYAHFGREIALQDGEYECLQEHYPKRYDPESWFDQAKLSALGDHAMQHYVTRIGEWAAKQLMPSDSVRSEAMP